MTLYLVRGLPGSAKSTYAKQMNIAHFENDMYFMRNGKYEFDQFKHKDAMECCAEMTRACLESGMDVVVSNVFPKRRSMYRYFAMAKIFGAEVKVIRMMNKFKDVHNVPANALKWMKENFEDYDREELVMFKV